MWVGLLALCFPSSYQLTPSNLTASRSRPPLPPDTNQHFVHQAFAVLEPYANACKSGKSTVKDMRTKLRSAAEKEIIDLLMAPARSIRGLCGKGPSGYTDLIRSFTPAPTETYADCAVVGSGGILLGSNKGREIDSREAVFRIHWAPTTHKIPSLDYSVDVGARTTWRVTHMNTFSYLPVYPPNWLRRHSSMADAPRTPLYAISCNRPFDGRCRSERLKQVFGRNGSATNHLISPALVRSVARSFAFAGIKQKSPTTGMVAITLARKLCRRVHVYGFSDGTCPGACYHYHDQMPCEFHEGHFFNQSAPLGASAGFHDFMSQISHLERLHSQGDITWHRGTGSACALAENVEHWRAVESEAHDVNITLEDAGPGMA